jgi:hypothetical protein
MLGEFRLQANAAAAREGEAHDVTGMPSGESGSHGRPDEKNEAPNEVGTEVD